MVRRKERWELTVSRVWGIPGIGRIQEILFLPSRGQQNPWDRTNADGLRHAFIGTRQRILSAAWDSTEMSAWEMLGKSHIEE